jgi:hypothetical protein
MGYGEFGGGGSVEWEVNHENTAHTPPPTSAGKANGHDSISVADMGVKKGAPAGHFRLEVMYGSPADAAAALTSIAVQGASLVFFVKSNTAVPGGGAKNPPQVRVSW